MKLRAFSKDKRAFCSRLQNKAGAAGYNLPAATVHHK